MTTEQIRVKAEELYTEIGPSAVYDFGNELGLEYSRCECCEADTPTLIDEQGDPECLLCSTTKES